MCGLYAQEHGSGPAFNSDGPPSYPQRGRGAATVRERHRCAATTLRLVTLEPGAHPWQERPGAPFVYGVTSRHAGADRAVTPPWRT